MSTAALRDVLRYGGLGLPLAFVALPLVVQWPAFAASRWGMPLAALGALLVAVRVADAFVDPWIGQRADGWFRRAGHAPWGALFAAAVLLVVGFVALFHAPAPLWLAGPSTGLWAWCVLALALTYLGYSLAQVVHQAWGARLGGDEVERSRWVGAREAFSLVGVMAASVLPTVAGWSVTATVLAVLLMLALAALWGLGSGQPAVALLAMKPGPAAESSPAAGSTSTSTPSAGLASPWRVPAFRSLLLVYTVNGLAASIPASLVLFFIRDRIQAPASFEAAALAAYFGAAALAVPMWVRVVRRLGLVTSWALGMGLAILSFAGAVAVGNGQTGLFLAICVASGLALGADLVAPPALLAGVIQRSGVQGQAEGRWFGWWSMATKLTLALAAGISLPLVQALGYAPGGRDAQALQALAIVYAAVPCAIKALALLAVLRWRHQWSVPRVPGATPHSPTIQKALP
jgi:GPH family glycoside/pentoside/hexuronide:cation symporter